MQINPAGLALIKEFEGLSLTVYSDVVGFSTVGYGHRTDLPVGSVITEEQATEFLLQDLAIAENAVSSLVKTNPNPNQFSAMVSLCYNIGVGNFSKSLLLRCVNMNNWADAAKQFDRWSLAGGRVIPGLLRRREAETTLFLAGS